MTMHKRPVIFGIPETITISYLRLNNDSFRLFLLMKNRLKNELHNVL